MLYVAFRELARRAQQQVRTYQIGCGVHQGHHVLQLVAKTKGAAGLVEGRACPKPASQNLVQQPSVGHNIQRAVRRLNLHGAQRVLPVLLHRVQRLVRGGRATPALQRRASLFGRSARTQAKNDLVRLPWGEHDRNAQGRTRVQCHTDTAREPGLLHGHRVAQAAVGT